MVQNHRRISHWYVLRRNYVEPFERKEVDYLPRALDSLLIAKGEFAAEMCRDGDMTTMKASDSLTAPYSLIYIATTQLG